MHLAVILLRVAIAADVVLFQYENLYELFLPASETHLQAHAHYLACQYSIK